jgi:hypothetical protein
MVEEDPDRTRVALPDGGGQGRCRIGPGPESGIQRACVAVVDRTLKPRARGHVRRYDRVYSPEPGCREAEAGNYDRESVRLRHFGELPPGAPEAAANDQVCAEISAPRIWGLPRGVRSGAGAIAASGPCRPTGTAD